MPTEPLDLDALRRRYQQGCPTCQGCACSTDRAENACPTCGGAGYRDIMPRDMQLLVEEIERLRTLMSEGDRQGEGENPVMITGAVVKRYVSSSRQVCPTCDGKGEVFHHGQDDWMKCPTCNSWSNHVKRNTD